MDKNFLSSIVALFNKLTIQQRFLIGGIIVGTFVIIGLLVFVYNEPDYNVLYTNLAPEDAAKIVDDLTASKIPYKIEDNGQTIRVPEENVYKTRLSLAAKGLPNSGIVGYEIF
ncbi:MAG TPA: flagellar M-ring protein FliF, partial [Ignavibacteriales bacterium]|nr:flagellar M-ring protein FliF [Ignavibacteriales bacterium]